MYIDHITSEESLFILMNKIKANLIYQMILFDTFKTNKRIIKQKGIGIQIKIIFYVLNQLFLRIFILESNERMTS